MVYVVGAGLIGKLLEEKFSPYGENSTKQVRKNYRRAKQVTIKCVEWDISFLSSLIECFDECSIIIPLLSTYKWV